MAQTGNMTAKVTMPPATTERCRLLLQRWRQDLRLTRREQGLLRLSLIHI